MADSSGSQVVPSGFPYAQIPIGQMMAAAEATAYLAQQQLAADVRSIEEFNATIAQSNSRALMMLADVSGRDFGADRVSWEKWLTDLQGYAYVSPPSPVDKPTVVEEVPISIVPLRPSSRQRFRWPAHLLRERREVPQVMRVRLSVMVVAPFVRAAWIV